ncbi:MAG: hypothetical protein AAFO73_08850 [Pseudomonadota bacterium]
MAIKTDAGSFCAGNTFVAVGVHPLTPEARVSGIFKHAIRTPCLAIVEQLVTSEPMNRTPFIIVSVRNTRGLASPWALFSAHFSKFLINNVFLFSPVAKAKTQKRAAR